MWFLAFFAISLLEMYLRKKLAPKQTRGSGQLDSPMSEEGYSIQVGFGTFHVKAPNCVWYGNERARDAGGGMYDYDVNMQLALCHGPVDRVSRMWINSKPVSPTPRLSSNRVTSKARTNVTGVAEATSMSVFPSALPAAGTVFIAKANGGYSDVGVHEPARFKNTKMLYRNTFTPVVVPDGWFVVPVANGGGYPGNTFADFFWYDTAPTPQQPSGAYPFGTWATRCQYYTFVQPANGDICEIDGTWKTWDGFAWNALPGEDFTTLVFNVNEDGTKVDARLDLHYGGLSQARNQELSRLAFDDAAGDKSPSYGGLCYAFFSHAAAWLNPGYIGNSPQVPEITLELARIPWGPNDSGVLYQKAIIADSREYKTIGDDTASLLDTYAYDANPAHVIYEILTNTRWGMAKPAADIDHHSFFSAATILHDEVLGMTMLIDQQENWDDILEDVQKFADGLLFEDVVTGKIQFRLLRPVLPVDFRYQDTWYSDTNWPVFDTTNVQGDVELSRSGWDEVVNDIRVQYTSRSYDYSTKIVQLKNDANFSRQDERVQLQATYAAASCELVAQRLAGREMRTFGYTRARIKMRVNRDGWKMNRGDRFVLNWEPLGIANMVFRVGEIDDGTLEDPTIEIQAFEDIYKLADTEYTSPTDGWTDPSGADPVAPGAVAILEMPYNLSGDGPRRSFAKLASQGDPYTTGCKLWWSDGTGPLQKLAANLPYAPTGILQSALSLEEYTSTLTIQGVSLASQIASLGGSGGGSNLALVGEEIIAWDSHAVNADGTVTFAGVLRGVLDTIPATHGIGARLWLLSDRVLREGRAQGSDYLETCTMQAYNSRGEIPLATSPTVSATSTSRQFRPFPPGRFRVGSDASLAGSVTDRVQVGALALAWSNRNRLTQAPGVVAQDASPITPEPGQVTDVRLSQGVAGMFELVDSNGAAFPFGTPVVVGATGNWATVKGAPLFYLAVGAGSWADAPLPSQAGVTYEIGVNLDTLQVEIVGTVAAANWIPLYLVNFAGAGAGRTATVYDQRTDDPVYIETMAGTENAGSVDPADFGVAASAAKPYRARLVAVRDGLDSRASRDTGDLLAGGWGLNWGMFWGGN